MLYQLCYVFCLRLTKLWCFISLNLPVCLCNCVQIYIHNYKRTYHKNRQKLLPADIGIVSVIDPVEILISL